MEYVVGEGTADRNATVQYKLTQIFGYADNMCIMGRMKDAVKQISEELKRAAREVGLSFDVNGTKLMVQSRHNTHIGKDVKIGGDTIEVVDEFVNVGTCITKHGYDLKDIKMRIEQANIAYHSLFPIMKLREVHRQTKIKL
jgi:hypothetical protein